MGKETPESELQTWVLSPCETSSRSSSGSLQFSLHVIWLPGHQNDTSSIGLTPKSLRVTEKLWTMQLSHPGNSHLTSDGICIPQWEVLQEWVNFLTFLQETHGIVPPKDAMCGFWAWTNLHSSIYFPTLDLLLSPSTTSRVMANFHC